MVNKVKMNYYKLQSRKSLPSSGAPSRRCILEAEEDCGGSGAAAVVHGNWNGTGDRCFGTLEEDGGGGNGGLIEDEAPAGEEDDECDAVPYLDFSVHYDVDSAILSVFISHANTIRPLARTCVAMANHMQRTASQQSHGSENECHSQDSVKSGNGGGHGGGGGHGRQSSLSGGPRDTRAAMVAARGRSVTSEEGQQGARESVSEFPADSGAGSGLGSGSVADPSSATMNPFVKVRLVPESNSAGNGNGASGPGFGHPHGGGMGLGMGLGVPGGGLMGPLSAGAPNMQQGNVHRSTCKPYFQEHFHFLVARQELALKTLQMMVYQHQDNPRGAPAQFCLGHVSLALSDIQFNQMLPFRRPISPDEPSETEVRDFKLYSISKTTLVPFKSLMCINYSYLFTNLPSVFLFLSHTLCTFPTLCTSTSLFFIMGYLLISCHDSQKRHSSALTRMPFQAKFGE